MNVLVQNLQSSCLNARKQTTAISVRRYRPVLKENVSAKIRGQNCLTAMTLASNLATAFQGKSVKMVFVNVRIHKLIIQSARVNPVNRIQTVNHHKFVKKMNANAQNLHSSCLTASRRIHVRSALRCRPVLKANVSAKIQGQNCLTAIPLASNLAIAFQGKSVKMVFVNVRIHKLIIQSARVNPVNRIQTVNPHKFVKTMHANAQNLHNSCLTARQLLAKQTKIVPQIKNA
jgi:NifU-like protein involved in Fe-S cluster formation